MPRCCECWNCSGCPTLAAEPLGMQDCRYQAYSIGEPSAQFRLSTALLQREEKSLDLTPDHSQYLSLMYSVQATD